MRGFKKILRRLGSEGGSAYLEYAMLTGAVVAIAVAAFAPGSPVNEALGSDYLFREALIKLPIL